MSRTDWEARYQAGDMPWEKGAPSPGLVDFLAANPQSCGGDALVAPASVLNLRREIQATATGASLPPSTVCVPGCGTGHDAREWARAGFRVYGHDPRPGPHPVELGADGGGGFAGGIPARRFFAGRTAVFIRLDF